MHVSIGEKLVRLGFILLSVSILICCVLSDSTQNNGKDKELSSVSNPVRVGVYFESLCPDSKRFFLNQLIPTYRDIGSIIEVNLVAFGHARVISANKIICQHGPRECEGNRLMACIATQPGASNGSILETIGCVFEKKNTDAECVQKFMPKVSFSELENCKNSSESYRLLISYEAETGRPGYVPHLTFNGEHSEDIQHGLEFNLKRYVCEHYNGTKPDSCSNLPEIKKKFYR